MLYLTYTVEHNDSTYLMVKNEKIFIKYHRSMYSAGLIIKVRLSWARANNQKCLRVERDYSRTNIQ